MSSGTGSGGGIKEKAFLSKWCLNFRTSWSTGTGPGRGRRGRRAGASWVSALGAGFVGAAPGPVNPAAVQRRTRALGPWVIFICF